MLLGGRFPGVSEVGGAAKAGHGCGQVSTCQSVGRVWWARWVPLRAVAAGAPRIKAGPNRRSACARQLAARWRGRGRPATSSCCALWPTTLDSPSTLSPQTRSCGACCHAILLPVASLAMHWAVCAAAAWGNYDQPSPADPSLRCAPGVAAGSSAMRRCRRAACVRSRSRSWALAPGCLSGGLEGGPSRACLENELHPVLMCKWFQACSRLEAACN